MLSPAVQTLASRVEAALQTRQALAHVVVAETGAQVIRLGLEPGRLERWDRERQEVVVEQVPVRRVLARAAELGELLGVDRVRVLPPTLGQPLIAVEFPHPHPRAVRLEALLATPAYDAFSRLAALPLILGEELSGRPLLADLADVHHLLSVGGTRDERSDLFTALLAGLLLAVPPRSLRVLVVGGLTSDQPLTWVADTPHALANPATTTPEAVALIGRLEREVARRHGDAATRRRGDTATPDDARSPSENPTIVGVIEDVGVLLPSERAIVEPALEHVVSFGPTVGVHLLLAAADATPRALTGLLAAQLRSRITFRTEAAARSERARSAIGEAGAELLLGSGDFLYCEAGGGDPSRRPCGFRNGPHFSKEALRRGQVPRVGERTLRGIGRRWPMDQTLADEPSHRWFAVTRRDTDPARAALTQQARALARQESGLTPRLIERRLQIGSALARSLWEELYAEGSLRT